LYKITDEKEEALFCTSKGIKDLCNRGNDVKRRKGRLEIFYDDLRGRTSTKCICTSRIVEDMKM